MLYSCEHKNWLMNPLQLGLELNLKLILLSSLIVKWSFPFERVYVEVLFVWNFVKVSGLAFRRNIPWTIISVIIGYRSNRFAVAPNFSTPLLMSNHEKVNMQLANGQHLVLIDRRLPIFVVHRNVCFSDNGTQDLGYSVIKFDNERRDGKIDINLTTNGFVVKVFSNNASESELKNIGKKTVLGNVLFLRFFRYVTRILQKQIS